MSDLFLCFNQSYLSKVQISPFTLVPSSVGPAADAGSGPLVTLGSVSMTLAGTAVGETPVTWSAAIAVLPKRSRMTLALASEAVTQSAGRSFQAAATDWTEKEKKEGRKSKRL